MSSFSKKQFSILLAVSLTITLISCAYQAKNIKALYVSKNKYQNINCQSLIFLAKKKENELINLSYKQKSIIISQQGIVFIFWPAIFSPPATADYEFEIARAKGEINAIKLAQKQAQC